MTAAIIDRLSDPCQRKSSRWNVSFRGLPSPP